MVFSSIEFLFRFLPIFLIAYFLTKPAYRNVTLLFGSLFFYAVGEPIYIFLMLASILINYFISKKIFFYRGLEQCSGFEFAKEKKYWLMLSMVYNFGMLFAFKYLGFMINTVNTIAHKEIFMDGDLTLPLGISFYTFQVASYVVDVYRGEFDENEKLIDVATYICMFPQLIAGPIVNYHEVEKPLKSRKISYAAIEWGVTVFIVGLTYKVLLANQIASLWNSVQTVGVRGISTPLAWLASWGYSMQIYFDFFGYSLMAIGLGCILGFRFPVNFKDPYLSKTATDFWRRWHITLGRWFREYVYIPLGGNRKGKKRLLINLLVVWSLTGLWHGASWNFVIWGVLFGVLIVIEKFTYGKRLEESRFLGHAYMLIVIPVSWTIFNITDIHMLLEYLCKLFFIPVEGSVQIDVVSQMKDYISQYWWLFLLCVIGCTRLPMRLIKKYYRTWGFRMIMLALFWFCVYLIASGANNPFLYFRF